MADMKIITGPSGPVVRPVSPARTEALRAAQRAFFDSALAGPAQPAPSRPAQPTAQAAEQAASGAPDPTQRYLRPGSRVDIKV
jgi:hypothetical protein